MEKNNKKEIIEEIAGNVSSKIMAASVVLAEKWINELLAIANINTPYQGNLNAIITLETSFFGVFYTQSRFKKEFDEEENILFSTKLKERLALLLSEVYLHGEDETKENRQKYIEKNKEFVQRHLDSRIKEYTESREGNITILFKKFLKEAFDAVKINLNEKLYDTYIKVILGRFSDFDFSLFKKDVEEEIGI